MNWKYIQLHFRNLIDEFKRYKKGICFIFILLICILLPKLAFANGMAQLGAFLVLGPVIIICVNIFKYFSLKSNKIFILSFGIIFGVIIAEICLIFIYHFPMLLIFFFFKLIGINIFELTESYPLLGLFVQAISFGLLAIFPNLFLVREKDQKFTEIATVPKKVLFAAMLAFITPTIGTILIISFT